MIMTDLYTVHFLSTANRKHTGFAYFNEAVLSKLLNSCKNNSYNLKLQLGDFHSSPYYVSFHPQPSSEVPEAHIGFFPIFAQRMGLKEGDNLLVSSCNLNSIETVHILPKNEDDYSILVSI